MVKKRLEIISVAFFALVSTVLLVACSGVDQSELQRNTREQNPAQSSINAESFIAYMNQARANMQKTSWRNDSENPNAFVQTSAPFELWVMLTVLFDDSGKPYAFQQQISRLKVKPATQDINSAWDFTDVLGVNAVFEALSTEEGEQVHVAQFAQRAALDLAGVDEERAATWVGAYEMVAHYKQDCIVDYAVTTPEVKLNFNQFNCAVTQNTETISVSQSEAMQVNGTYSHNGENIALVGTGWLVHAWGMPPESNVTAVVFDRAWMSFDNATTLRLQRSRRRSGRGPSITTGSYALGVSNSVDAQTKNQKLVEPVFDHERFGGDTTNVQPPMVFSLSEQSQNIDVEMRVVNDHANSRLFGANRFNAVVVEGSHQGAGFVSFAREDEQRFE